MHVMNEIERLMVSAHLLDERGRPCPVPIIELARALRAHPQVELWADDPAAWEDLQAFALETGHQLERTRISQSLVQALIRRRYPMELR